MNFFGWKTNEELLVIINSDNVDSDLRMKAAAERIQRSGPPCKVPGCLNSSASTWATIPVCNHCKATLTTEQLAYYSSKPTEDKRTVIHKIAPLMPWLYDGSAVGS